MPFSAKSIEEKPYNMCLNCNHIGKKCDGPNFLAMSTDRWCEWCKLRKQYLGWTSAQVAEKADVSEITVNRVMSGNVKDLRISSMQAITRALVNGSWGQYPCALAEIGDVQTVYVDNPLLVERAEHAMHECQRLQEALDAARADDQRKIDFLKEQVKFKEDQLKEKDKLLDERYSFIKRKDNIIAILAVALSLALLVIIVALIIDRTNSGVGFFWLDSLFKPHGITEIIKKWSS